MKNKLQAFIRNDRNRRWLIIGLCLLAAAAVAALVLMNRPEPMPVAVATISPTASPKTVTPAPTEKPLPTATPRVATTTPTQKATETAVIETTEPPLSCTGPEMAAAVSDWFDSQLFPPEADREEYPYLYMRMEENAFRYDPVRDDWWGMALSTGISDTKTVASNGDLYTLYTLDVLLWGEEYTKTLVTVPLVYAVGLPDGTTKGLGVWELGEMDDPGEILAMIGKPYTLISLGSGGLAYNTPRGIDWQTCTGVESWVFDNPATNRLLCDLGKDASPQNGELPGIAAGVQPPENWVLMGLLPAPQNVPDMETFILAVADLPACQP